MAAGMQDALNFAGKTVLVVGGSSGIGNGIAQAFRARGAGVALFLASPLAAYVVGQTLPADGGLSFA
jgi:3-oxoacyl-[acyl-carrier protein] reductase